MSEPRIVLWDLETLPNLKEVMKIFPSLSNYPGLTMKASINSIICFGYKIYGEKKTHCINAWDFPEWNKNVNDDKKLCQEAYSILSAADAIVTHNGRRFDWKFFQTRLLLHGMKPLSNIMHIDTGAASKSNLLM
jgi:DNA polymerase elongation subunit (family B)